MFTRRNWLLRCSILINIAVVLYICSHVMIGGGSNFATGPAYFIQEDGPKLRQMTSLVEKKEEVMKVRQEQERENTPKDESSPKSEIKQQQQPQQQELRQEMRPAESGNIVLSDESSGATQVQFQQQQQQQQERDIETSQQQQQQQQQQHEQQQQSKVISEPNDEKHYEMPTDPNYAPSPEKISNEAPAVAPPAAAAAQESVSFSNNTSSDSYVPTGDEKDFEDRLKSILKCHNRDYVPETLQRGDFWVLKNYIRADHGELKCHETITYTTHADYTFLDNLIPLLERWNAPISIALHAPGADFAPTINSLKYLRDCLPESNLVRQYVTFHIYFSTKHIPKNIPKSDKVLETSFNCSLLPPFVNVSSGQLYKTQKKLLYPVNVGRNIARDSSLTHYILASDIELYPNPGLVKKFLEMIARNDVNLQRKNPRVYPLSIFEVESSSPVPKDKTELQELLKTGKAIPFHKRVCSSCHGVPKSKEWMAANETEELGVFHIGKRIGYFVHWEPIYIGTNADPHYDERLSWEGKSDKMTQGYALCALDYEFHILDNGFLVHKPGIKILKKDPRRAMLAAKTNQLIKKIIYPELRIMYGTRKGCAV